MQLLLFGCAFISAHARPWMNKADPPATRAQKLVANMDLEAKLNLFHGSCKGYTGNVCGNNEYGIPTIKMEDGPQGFRGIDGTSTAWPSGLTIGATFDEVAAQTWGSTMGVEFYNKGANVQLGPGLCLARVPRNGRNFEYISGEDPYLGYTMVGPVIRGIQSSGVIANAKHWVNNNQETNRHGVVEDVDERTQFEMYYPPFQGAVDNGVGSIMCSYNKVLFPTPSRHALCAHAQVIFLHRPISVFVCADPTRRFWRREVELREPRDAAARPQRPHGLQGMGHERLGGHPLHEH